MRDHIEEGLQTLLAQTGSDPMKLPKGAISKAQGSSQVSSFTGSLCSYERGKIKVKTKKEMLKDVDVQFALSALTAPISSCEWAVECSDPDIVLFLTEALQPLWRSLILSCLEAVPFGFQCLEKVYDIQDVELQGEDQEIQVLRDRAVYAELYDVDPEKVQIIKDNQGNLRGFEVNEKLIPVDLTGKSLDKGAIISLPRVRWGNFHGEGRLDVAYGPWWTKTATMRLMMQYMERHGNPPIVAWAPRGEVYDEKGKKYDQIDLMTELVARIKGGANVVLPHILDEQGNPAYGMELLKDETDRGAEWLEVLEHLSILIMRAFLNPEKTLVEGAKTGSFALVKEQRSIALQNAESIQSAVFEQLSNQILPPLLLANYGPSAPKARLIPGPLDQASLDLLSEVMGFIVDYEKGQVPERPLTEMINRPKLLETLRIPVDQDVDERMEDPDSISINTKEGDGTEPREIPEDQKEEVEKEPGEMSMELASFREVQRKYLKEVRARGEAFKSNLQDPLLEKTVEQMIRDIEKALNAGTPAQQARALKKVQIPSKEYQKILEEFLNELHAIGRRSLAEELDLKGVPNMTPEDKEFIKTLSSSLASDRAQAIRKIGMVAAEGGLRWKQSPAEISYEIRQRSEKLLKNRSNQTTATSEAWRGFQDGRRSVAEEERKAEDPIWAAQFVNDNPVAQICKDLQGQVIRADDPRFFAYHPPLHHNCTTTLKYLRRSEYEKMSPEAFQRPSPSSIKTADEFFVPKELLSVLSPVELSILKEWDHALIALHPDSLLPELVHG